MTHFFGRMLFAGLLAGTALPVLAEPVTTPDVVFRRPLPLNGEEQVERRILPAPTAPLAEATAAEPARQAAPVVAVPAPVVAVPAPVVAVPAPVVATPAPVEASPAPIVATPAPVVATPAGSVEPVTTAVVAPVASPLPAVDPMPTAITTALSEMVGSPTGFAAKRRAAAVKTFYEDRADQPAWVSAEGVTPKGRAVVDRLADAGADGLDPAALGIPSIPGTTVPADLAAFDVALSRAVASFAEEASAGRIEPSSINKKFITRKPERADPIQALDSVANAIDAATALDEFNPPHEAFRRLKAELAEIRGRPDEPAPEPIPEGSSLKPGMTDVRVPLLRARFDLAAPVDTLVTDVYDEALAEAVRTFQTDKGLEADGIIGRRTLAVLNGADRDAEGEILANMEMWRWMPRKLGRDYVFVNIPEFTARVVRDGRPVHQTRVVVGTPTNQTPVFSDEMEYLVVNPYWHVPESIRMKEMLPEIQADPAGFFQRHGYEAVWNGEVIDPRSVIWDENAVKFVAIRQPPSEANALGRIKFMFPNQHAVYLHDTPSRKLFLRDYRAYSHGCVRVDDPMEFARAILDHEPNLTVESLEAMFGGQETRVDLTQHLRVHIAYFNTWVDDAGNLQIRDDLYGHTASVKAALGGTSVTQ